MVEGMVGVWSGKKVNYGKEFTATGEGIRVTVRKTQVEVINKLSEEQWFSINRSKSKEEIAAVINKIEDKCITSLKRFIEVYGGSTDFSILKRERRPFFNNLNTKSDNKVMNEPFIDSIPLNMTFETENVKKVYKLPNVEFSTPLLAAQYLENSALHEFAPEITSAIKSVADELSNSKGVIERLSELQLKQAENTNFLGEKANFLAENINSHIPAYTKIAENTEANTATVKDNAILTFKLLQAVNRLNKNIKENKGELSRFLSRSSKVLDSQQSSLLSYFG